MKKLMAVMLILLIGIFAGCTGNSTGSSDDDGPGDGPLTGGSENAEEFFPFTGEKAWTYEETRTENGQSPVTSEVTLSTQGTQTHEGKTYSVVHNPITYADKYLRIENNIIYEYQYATQESPWLNFNADKGKAWKVYNFSDKDITTSSNGKFLGAENVTVPAGTYPGCMKFEVTEELNFHYSDGYTGSSSNTETYWLCKNVGPVKIVENIQVDDTYSLTATKELKSFDDGS